MWGPSYLASWISQLSGLTSFPAAVVAALVAGAWAALIWHRRETRKGNRGVQAWQIFAVGTAGAWLFASIAIVALLWFIVSNKGFALASSGASSEENGPLEWYYNLELEGGGNRPIFSLRFRGQNVSQKEVLLKSASIRSAIKGAEIPLEVIAENEFLRLDQINLIPSGAPIHLIAKFNLPDGVSVDDFLATWSKFNLVVTDDTREYRLPFNEGNIAPFFPGKVGPHISKK
jgi:hypothetical protein